MGERRLLLGTTPAGRTGLRRHLLHQADGFRPDGALLVHTPLGEDAQGIVEEVLFESTRAWRRAGRLPNARGVESLAYLVRLRKKQVRPAELLGNLDECSVQVRAAEYLPLTREALERHGREGGHPHGKHHPNGGPGHHEPGGAWAEATRRGGVP